VSKNYEDDADSLETLLKFAGRRESVAPERAERVEENAYGHWQTMLQRRQRTQRRRQVNRFAAGFAVAASVVAAVILLPQTFIDAPVVAVVDHVVGAPVSGARGEPMEVLGSAMELRAGSVLETADNDGLSLQLATGHNLRLAAASRVRIEERSIVLDRGAIYVDSGGDNRATPIDVLSSLATVRELGTQYSVRLSDGMLVTSVREGAVQLELNGSELVARAGEMLLLEEDGSSHRKSIPKYGELWSWVNELSPATDVEGLTLADFLQQVVREYGWQLQYESGSLERDASEIELHGSIEDLHGEDVVAAVMVAVGWSHKLTDGVLYIRQP
jgi:ferric-dicitrate binding protein FerR (iron transport regulator)